MWRSGFFSRSRPTPGPIKAEDSRGVRRGVSRSTSHWLPELPASRSRSRPESQTGGQMAESRTSAIQSGGAAPMPTERPETHLLTNEPATLPIVCHAHFNHIGRKKSEGKPNYYHY